MPGASNTSFIPKRNPTKRDKTTVRKQVYVGTLLVRIFFFATIIAAIVLYIYQSKLQSDLDRSISELDASIADFNETDMKKVIDMDKKLRQANSRLQNSSSIVAILKAVEESTVQATQINSLSVERVDDNVFALSLDLQARAFDAVMFQRLVFAEKQEKLNNSEVDDLKVQNQSDEGEFLTSSTEDEAKVDIIYKATVHIDADKVRHTPLITSPSETVVDVNTNDSNTAEGLQTQSSSDSNQTNL